MGQPIDLTATVVNSSKPTQQLFIKFHVNHESHSGSRGIALRSEGKILKKTETVNRMKGVCIYDENAVKVRKM